MKEKPLLDRGPAHREDQCRQQIESTVHAVMDLLADGEGLGTPERVGAAIIIPVCDAAGRAEDVDAHVAEVRALLRSLLE